MLKRLITNNFKKIPLIWVNFNLQHFRKRGKKGSCLLNVHPNLRNDEHIRETLDNLVDYIRDKYYMEDM